MDKDRKELLEKVRTFYRTTATGRKVRWDEPTETGRNEPLRVNKDKFRQDLDFWKKKNQKNSSQLRLKKKNAVPTKNGEPMWEELQTENYVQFASLFRKQYNSNRTMTFRKWCEVVEELLDTLT
jgi:hypothetical protein